MERPDLRISPLIQQGRSGLISFSRDGTRQAREDWLARWRGLSTWFLSTIWFSGLCVSLNIMDTIPMSEGLGARETACQPDGIFSSDPSKFRYWSSSGFFQISLGFGSLSFTQAKAIDIIWDVIMGRGGQAILAFISWRVFANYVTTSMEVAPVTFRTYRTIFLQNESNLLLAIPRMIRDFTFRHRLTSKFAMVFMVMTMTFILAFPTWASAMTGYSGNQEARVTTPDNNLVPFTSLNFAYFIIHDGWRINKEGNFIVTSNMSHNYEPVATTTTALVPDYCYDLLKDCFMLRNVTAYGIKFGFNGLNATNSTFMGIDLSPPVLNISAIYTPSNFFSMTDIPYYGDFPYPKEQQTTWAYENTTYTSEELKKAGRCQPLPRYQWGFSFIQLTLMLIVLMVWSCGIFVMWLHAYIIMNKRGRTSVVGDYKALFELTEAIQNQLSDHGKEEAEDIKALPDSEIHRRVAKDLRGGSMAYESDLLSQSRFREHIKQWIVKEKVWIFVFCVALCIMGGNIAHLGDTPVIFGLAFPLEVIVAVYVGTSNQSRSIIFFWAFIVLGVTPQIIFAIINYLRTV